MQGDIQTITRCMSMPSLFQSGQLGIKGCSLELMRPISVPRSVLKDGVPHSLGYKLFTYSQCLHLTKISTLNRPNKKASPPHPPLAHLQSTLSAPPTSRPRAPIRPQSSTKRTCSVPALIVGLRRLTQTKCIWIACS